jgi:S1-C subfamily serine protease
LDTPQGVTVTWVNPRSALAQAGLEVQDLLLAIEGHAIEGVDALAELVAALKPQQHITVLALDHRSGETGSIQAVIPQYSSTIYGLGDACWGLRPLSLERVKRGLAKPA